VVSKAEPRGGGSRPVGPRCVRRMATSPALSSQPTFHHPGLLPRLPNAGHAPTHPGPDDRGLRSGLRSRSAPGPIGQLRRLCPHPRATGDACEERGCGEGRVRQGGVSDQGIRESGNQGIRVSGNQGIGELEQWESGTRPPGVCLIPDSLIPGSLIPDFLIPRFPDS
jgi:hypothetical protein